MKGIYRPIAEHLRTFCAQDQFVIYLDSFRWKRYKEDDPWLNDENHQDEVLSNHYDSMSLEQLAEDFGYEIDWKFNLHHVAIVRMK
jgi:hypothetical protein